MEIHQLQYFLVLCRHLNYSRAAEQLYLSRQALRQSIAALERELGEPLFCNQRNHLSLTERGQWLCRHAQPVVERFDQLQKEVFATLRSAQPLRFGVSVALLPDYLPSLPRWLEQFKTLYPNLNFEVSVQNNDDVLAGVEGGALAMGLIMDQASASYAVERRVLRRDPLCFELRWEHPLSGQKALSPGQLKGEVLLIPSLREEPFASLRQLCRKAGFEPDLQLAPSFYEANYQVRSLGHLCVTRPDPAPSSPFYPTLDLPLEGADPLCVSLLLSAGVNPSAAALVQRSLLEEAVSL